MLFPRFLRLLPLLLTASGAFAQTPPLLQQAVDKLVADDRRWAYTQTVLTFERNGSPKDGETVERFDPSLAPEDQWSLLRYEGREPTASDRRTWAKRKERERKRRGERSLGEIIDFPRAAVLEDSAEAVRFRVPLKPGSSRRFPAEKFAAFIRVDKASGGIGHLAVKSEDDFRVAVGMVKVDAVEIDATFRIPVEGYAPQPSEIRASGSGRILFFPVGGSARITWSDFKRVTPWDERFEVKIGEIRALDF